TAASEAPIRLRVTAKGYAANRRRGQSPPSNRDTARVSRRGLSPSTAQSHRPLEPAGSVPSGCRGDPPAAETALSAAGGVPSEGARGGNRVPPTRSAVNRDDERDDQDRDDIGDLDHRVDRRAGRVLVGIADRVAGDR